MRIKKVLSDCNGMTCMANKKKDACDKERFSALMRRLIREETKSKTQTIPNKRKRL